MLKIKDNVNLKELEKFGFKYYEDGDFYCYEKADPLNSLWNVHESWIKTTTIIIIAENLDRNIRVHLGVQSKGNDNDCGRDVYGIDIIFDLISAGLVEKVGE